MTRHRTFRFPAPVTGRPTLAAGAILLGVGITWGIAGFVRPLPGPVVWLLFLAGLFSAAGAIPLHRRARVPEGLADREADLARRERRFRKERRRAEREMRRRARVLHARQQALTHRLMIHHEEREFPEVPDDLQPHEAAAESRAEAERLRRDEAVHTLLERRTEAFFDKIKRNTYQSAEGFRRDLLLADLLEMVTDVARIQQPGSEAPLLETSVEALLRAVNRISLQTLVLLEQLPLDVKSYNLNRTYETIRTGVRAYDAYRTAEPYFTLFRPVYYLGRFTLGASPVTLGAGWALGELFRGGTKRLSTHLANQYLLGLLRDVVFVIGTETATVFGGDYRHRDPHWIYGAELVHMVSCFPLTRNTLLRSLNAVGHLRLRSEYDRIYLYRCLADHQSPRPERFGVGDRLPWADRRRIADLLERFFTRTILPDATDIHPWREGVEHRLGLKLRSPVTPEGPSESSPAASGLFSLAGFLTDVKGVAPEAVEPHLEGTRLSARLEATEREAVLAAIREAPPMVFDYPEAAVDDPVVDLYLDDLMDLSVRLPPRDDPSRRTLAEVGHYFRRKDTSALSRRRDRAALAFLEENLVPASPGKRPSARDAWDLLAVLGPGEAPRFLYAGAAVEPRAESRASLRVPPYLDPWLLGTDDRLILVGLPNRRKEADIEAVVMWSAARRGDPPPRTERVEGRLADACRLTGGTWHWDRAQGLFPPPALVISGRPWTRFQNHFGPLLEFRRDPDGPAAAKSKED